MDLYSYTIDQTERNSAVNFNIFDMFNGSRIFFLKIFEYVFLTLKDIVKLWPHTKL